MFFSGRYSKNQRANEVNVTSDDFKSGEKTSPPFTSNTSNSKDNDINTTKSEESYSTTLPLSSTSSVISYVSNKRKIEEDDKAGDEKIDVTGSPKKPKNENVNLCKRERWQVVSDEVEVDLFCVQGWRDELCRCDKACKKIKKKNTCLII